MVSWDDKGQEIFLTPLDMLTSLFFFDLRGTFWNSQKNTPRTGPNAQRRIAFLGVGPSSGLEKELPLRLIVGRMAILTPGRLG